MGLPQGADLESASRKYGVTAAARSGWRRAFLPAGEEGLRIRQEGLADEQDRHEKRVNSGLATESGLLHTRIRRLEPGKPYRQWGSKP